MKRMISFFRKIIFLSAGSIAGEMLSLCAYAARDENVSGEAVRAVTTGENNYYSIVIGISLLAVGTIGFILIKLREKKLNNL